MTVAVALLGGIVLRRTADEARAPDAGPRAASRALELRPAAALTAAVPGGAADGDNSGEARREDPVRMLAGEVFRYDSGEPVSGATIRIAPKTTPVTSTRANGSFEFAVAGGPLPQFVVEHDAYTPSRVRGADAVSRISPIFLAPATACRVKVVDAADGAPLEGALVSSVAPGADKCPWTRHSTIATETTVSMPAACAGDAGPVTSLPAHRPGVKTWFQSTAAGS